MHQSADRKDEMKYIESIKKIDLVKLQASEDDMNIIHRALMLYTALSGACFHSFYDDWTAETLLRSIEYIMDDKDVLIDYKHNKERMQANIDNAYTATEERWSLNNVKRDEAANADKTHLKLITKPKEKVA